MTNATPHHNPTPRGEDTTAFDALFSSMAERVLAIGYQLTGNAATAEDVLQDTFVAVYRNMGAFRGDAAIETWVFRIAVNEAKRARTRLGKHRHTGFGDEPGSPRHHAEDTGGGAGPRDASRALFAALERLPETQRDAISMLAVRGLSGAVAASVLGVPEGTVYSRAHAARLRLRELLGEDFGAPSSG